MTDQERDRRKSVAVLVVGCGIAWSAAMSGRIASSLASHDLLPPAVGWLLWPRGQGVLVRDVGAVLGLGLLTWIAVRLARPRWLAAPVVVLGVVAAVWAPTVPYPGARALFASMQSQLDQVAALPAVAGPGPANHDVTLPHSLRPVAVYGYVSTDGAGGVFVPQWAAIVDDAGGFWYTAGTSPEGRDMWGMICTEPTRLDGDWWACGMKVEPGGDW